MSACSVQNVVSEDMKGYIDQQDLLRLLKSLFPDVAQLQDFKLNVWFPFLRESQYLLID